MAPRSKRRKRRKKRSAEQRALRSGWGAVLGHLCLAVAVPWVLAPGGGEDVVGFSIFSLAGWLFAIPFVYYGVSRLVVPHLPMWLPQTEYGQTSNGSSVVFHAGSKEYVSNRRRSALGLAMGIAVWCGGVGLGVWVSQGVAT